MLRPFSTSLEGVCRCVMASQHVWVPVTHWPCFFYWVTVQLSGVLLLKSFNLSTAWLHRTHETHTCPVRFMPPRILNGGAHTHTRYVLWRMHEYFLSSSVLITLQYMNTPKTTSLRYHLPSPFGTSLKHPCEPLVGACDAHCAAIWQELFTGIEG